VAFRWTRYGQVALDTSRTWKHVEASMNDQQPRPADHRRRGEVDGSYPVGRRSVLRGIVGGVAGAVAASPVASGVAHAASHDDYNLEATREGTRKIPFKSRGLGEFTDKAVSAMRNEFGGHTER
jgi:hypothetical protein